MGKDYLNEKDADGNGKVSLLEFKEEPRVHIPNVFKDRKCERPAGGRITFQRRINRGLEYFYLEDS